jgi:YD repeat-containing protein
LHDTGCASSRQSLTVTDPLGRTTQYAYDAFGRVIREQSPAPATGQAGPLQSFGYDPAGNLRIVVDGRRKFTEYRYDDRDRLIATLEADPDGKATATTCSLPRREITRRSSRT